MRGDLAAFVDTNVLVYAVSTDDPAKQKKARAIVEQGFAEGCYAISTQVLLEVYVKVTQKAKIRLPAQQAFEYIRAFTEWRVVEMVPALLHGLFQFEAGAGGRPARGLAREVLVETISGDRHQQ